MAKGTSARLIATVTGLLATSCGPGVPSAGTLGEPLARLRAQVVTVGNLVPPDRGVHASLLWAALSQQAESCLASATTATEARACTGDEVRPRLTSHWVPVEPAFPSAFELPLHQLPAPEVLTGNERARLGYGLLVVHHDRNENHALDLIPPDVTDGPDLVLGTSLRAGSSNVGDYVAFREGAVPAAWGLFRLLANCPEPPLGFFVIRIAKESAGLTCTLASAEESLTVELSDDPLVRAHACQHAAHPEIRRPLAAPPAVAQARCFGRGSLELVRDPSATCRRIERYELTGPGWDLSSNPPAWWPCVDTPVTLALRDSASALSNGPDELFELDYVQGTESYQVKNLRLVIFRPEGDVILRSPDPLLIQGMSPLRVGASRPDFAPGDTMYVSEASEDQFTPSSVGPHQVRLELVASDGRAVPLSAPLSWTP
ncbi:MAG: hypothetical protein ACT4TC_04635 [Myxococcaceae bacterium]